jgi:hypothetical protein
MRKDISLRQHKKVSRYHSSTPPPSCRALPTVAVGETSHLHVLLPHTHIEIGFAATDGDVSDLRIARDSHLLAFCESIAAGKKFTLVEPKDFRNRGLQSGSKPPR